MLNGFVQIRAEVSLRILFVVKFFFNWVFNSSFQQVNNGLTLSDLPLHMLSNILHRFSDGWDIITLGQVTPTLYMLSEDRQLWKKLCQYHFAEKQVIIICINVSHLCCMIYKQSVNLQVWQHTKIVLVFFCPFLWFIWKIVFDMSEFRVAIHSILSLFFFAVQSQQM